jgi:hypothetical protein
VAVVVVSGALANRCSNGGGAWVRLNWILGLKRLGHDVHFVEVIGRGACINAAGAPAEFLDSANLTYFRRVMGQFGLAVSATLVFERGEQTAGRSYADLLDLASSADLLINLGGHLGPGPLFDRFRRTAYIDLDPGFTQAWHADPDVSFTIPRHDDYFTVGGNVGSPSCAVPVDGLPWRPICPPVVLDHWPVTPADVGRGFTTVACWRGPFGPVALGGRTLGLKVHEFRKCLDLPRRTGLPFEIALNIHPADDKDRSALARHGWKLVDPAAVAPDPPAFRRYLQGSAAEFSAAQSIYVETQSGWFSDRTACYLASGRPALVQDTGFGRHIPTGEGLLTFRTPDEAAAGAAAIRRYYARHCRAARAIAAEFFDSDGVLGRFGKEVGVAP